MSRFIIQILLLLTLINCNSPSSNIFNDIPCNQNYSPEYDPQGLTGFKDKNGIDTYKPIGKLRKELKIFKPCKEYYYNGTYFSPDRDLIFQTSIRLIATGRRWQRDSFSQDEVIVQYSNNKSELEAFNNLQYFDSYKIYNLVVEDTIGIVENSEEIWFHQLFRNNQFRLTELAGPVNIDYPIGLHDVRNTHSRIKHAGEMNLDSISNDFINNSIECTNTVIDRSTYKSNIGKLENCWTFLSESKSRLGMTILTYKFHEEMGFLNFDYTGITGERVIIELQEIR